MLPFKDDDDGYLAWVAANPGLYVLNTERNPRPSYLVLHRATCHTINGSHARGLQWTGEYVKFCGSRSDLEAFARDNVGGEARPCGLCSEPPRSAATLTAMAEESFLNRWADAVGPGDPAVAKDRCWCFNQYEVEPPRKVRFHGEPQDTESAGWLRLLELIDEAADDEREVFKPLVELTPQQRRQIITLPTTVAKLTKVKHLVLYGSNLVRIPPEIGAMESLEEFTPYTSHRLHWFPYELTRCTKLKASTVSTRSLYGNRTVRAPFPALPAQPNPAERCSVCDTPVTDSPHQVWISLRVATDVLPLLVNACSPACIQQLPAPTANYVLVPHTGGPAIEQPIADWA